MIECYCNDGFEDQLVSPGFYQVVEYGGNSVRIVNNNGDLRWYGMAGKFRLAK